MDLAKKLLDKFGDRLSELHISDVRSDYYHMSISPECLEAYQKVSIPKEVPGRNISSGTDT
jgi:hypothetical protein